MEARIVQTRMTGALLSVKIEAAGLQLRTAVLNRPEAVRLLQSGTVMNWEVSAEETILLPPEHP